MTDTSRAAEPDVIEHGGGRGGRGRRGGRRGDRPDREDREPWISRLPETTRRRVSLLLAFAVGVAAGVTGWYRWDRAADARSERSAVALVAWMSYSGLNQLEGQQVVDAYVRLHNAGSLPVKIERLELIQPGLRSHDFLPEGLEVTPDQTATLSVRSDLLCDELDESRPPTLVVHARPASGVVVERRITLIEGGDSPGLAGGYCGGLDTPTLDVGLNYMGNATVSGKGLEARLRSAVAANAWTPSHTELTVTGLRSTTSALDLSADGLPVTVEENPAATIKVTWRVADCSAATDLEANQLTTVELVGRRRGHTGELHGTADLGPDLLLALVRFVGVACR
jgi:hypothetical protein